MADERRRQTNMQVSKARDDADALLAELADGTRLNRLAWNGS
jgi:hypothetical protein